MPRLILVEEAGEREVVLPGNATLADGLRALGSRAGALEILEGESRLTPPTPRERRRFGGVDWTRRLPDQAGIIGESTVRARLRR